MNFTTLEEALKLSPSGRAFRARVGGGQWEVRKVAEGYQLYEHMPSGYVGMRAAPIFGTVKELLNAEHYKQANLAEAVWGPYW